MRTDEPELDIAAFHCQQAVEKTLKAFLVFSRTEFGKVHDLGLLLDLCRETGEDFESIRERIEPLTVFAVAFRYPGPPDPSLRQVRSALDIVESVWSFVAQHLPADVVPNQP